MKFLRYWNSSIGDMMMSVTEHDALMKSNSINIDVVHYKQTIEELRAEIDELNKQHRDGLGEAYRLGILSIGKYT